MSRAKQRPPQGVHRRIEECMTGQSHRQEGSIFIGVHAVSYNLQNLAYEEAAVHSDQASSQESLQLMISSI